MQRLVLIAILALFPSLASAQQSFRIICRGGANMRVRISPGDTHNSYQKLGLFFTRSKRAAGQRGAGLSNGTCAWVDRPLNNREPDILAQDIRRGFQYKVQLDSSKHVVRFTPTNSWYNWVNVLRVPGKYWTFYAYNTNQGELKITRSYEGNGIQID